MFEAYEFGVSQQNHGEQFCDSHCTWLDHHPACNHGNKSDAPALAWMTSDKRMLLFADVLNGNNGASANGMIPLYAAPPEVAALQARIAELESEAEQLRISCRITDIALEEWRLVPLEPTTAMLQVSLGFHASGCQMGEIYRSMIAAAPTPDSEAV